jgi:hypothetical protein
MPGARANHEPVAVVPPPPVGSRERVITHAFPGTQAAEDAVSRPPLASPPRKPDGNGTQRDLSTARRDRRGHTRALATAQEHDEVLELVRERTGLRGEGARGECDPATPSRTRCVGSSGPRSCTPARSGMHRPPRWPGRTRVVRETEAQGVSSRCGSGKPARTSRLRREVRQRDRRERAGYALDVHTGADWLSRCVVEPLQRVCLLFHRHAGRVGRDQRRCRLAAAPPPCSSRATRTAAPSQGSPSIR